MRDSLTWYLAQWWLPSFDPAYGSVPGIRDRLILASWHVQPGPPVLHVPAARVNGQLFLPTDGH